MHRNRERITSSPLSEFLKAFPIFTFDFKEYLQARRHSEVLQRRWAEFQQALSNPPKYEHVLSKIIETIRGLGTTIPAYDHPLYRSASRFEDLPILDKEHLLAKHSSYCSSSYSPTELWLKSSSGTTGRFLDVFYSSEFYFELLLLSIRKIALIAGFYESLRQPIACLNVGEDSSCYNWVVPDPLDEIGLILQFALKESVQGAMEQLFTLIAMLEPACVSANPCILQVILESAETAHTNAFSNVQFVISSGANLSGELRDCFQNKFGIPVINAYGITEFGLVASELEPGGPMYIHDPMMVLELLGEDSRSQVTEEKVGQLVITSVSNTAMPLVRYNTSDLGCYHYQPITGRRLLSAIVGRRIDLFRFPGNTPFSASHFFELLWNFPLSEFAITQTAQDAILVEIEPLQATENLVSIASAVSNFLRWRLPPGVRTTVRTTRFDRRSQVERFKSVL